MNFGGWTNFEEKRVREMYPSATRDEICATIPRHKWESISNRAGMLKVRRIYPVPRAIHPFIEALVARRKARGLTQEALAEVMNMDRSMLSSLERGRKLPKLTTLERWCEALGGEFGFVEKVAAQ